MKLLICLLVFVALNAVCCSSIQSQLTAGNRGTVLGGSLQGKFTYPYGTSYYNFWKYPQYYQDQYHYPRMVNFYHGAQYNEICRPGVTEKCVYRYGQQYVPQYYQEYQEYPEFVNYLYNQYVRPSSYYGLKTHQGQYFGDESKFGTIFGKQTKKLNPVYFQQQYQYPISEGYHYPYVADYIHQQYQYQYPTERFNYYVY